MKIAITYFAEMLNKEESFVFDTGNIPVIIGSKGIELIEVFLKRKSEQKFNQVKSFLMHEKFYLMSQKKAAVFISPNDTLGQSIAIGFNLQAELQRARKQKCYIKINLELNAAILYFPMTEGERNLLRTIKDKLAIIVVDYGYISVFSI